jgi:hypothetical protein
MMAMLAFLFIAGLSAAQDAASDQSASSSAVEDAVSPASASDQVVSSAGNTTSEVAISEAATSKSAKNKSAGGEAAAETSSENAGLAKLQYIWSITGIEDDQITMVLNQNGTELYGQAKYEPEDSNPWNAVVSGSVNGNNVSLVMTTEGKKVVSTKMDGTFADEVINGKFFQTQGGRITKRGDFSAQWINPIISDYTPAEVKDESAISGSKSTTSDFKAGEASEETSITHGSSDESSDQTSSSSQDSNSESSTSSSSSSKKTKYVDVHEWKDKIGPGGDLSMVPPGMGGAAGV